MSSTSRKKCLEWFLDQVHEHRDTIGLIHRTKTRGLNGADVTISVYDGGCDVSLYYFDLPTPASVLRDIVRKNTSMDIATVFVCDHRIVPGNKHGETVEIHDRFLLDQMLFSDGRIHVWNGDSIREMHYERAPDKLRKGRDYLYTLHTGSTIDVSGLIIVDMSHIGDFKAQATTARFSYRKFWQEKDDKWKSTNKEKTWDSASHVNWEDVERERNTSDGTTGFGGRTWDEWFSYFNQAYQRQYDDAFFYGNSKRNAGRYPGSPNHSGAYAVLGLTSSATNDEIKKAYRKLVRQYHPDISDDPNATAKTKQINEAYADLKKARGIR